MTKIPFDIKYRPQIESGEYKVETRDGKPARIICWDAKGDDGELIVLLKYSNEEPVYRYFRNGSYHRSAKRSSFDLFIITPELVESEDERILKDIRLVIESAATRYFKETKTGEMPEWYDRIVSYLEKQKEHKPTAEEILAKAGLKPYKDGNKWCILIGDNIQEGICGFGDTIDEAFYQFLIDVLEQQKEQKPAEWDEEDKRAIDRACVALRAYANGYLPEILPSELVGYADKLQSLLPCPHWKPAEWSEEDLQHKSWILECLADGERKMPEYAEDFRAAYKWLKSLCPPPRWKPSEEQIGALADAIMRDVFPKGNREHLESLYNELKKL